MRLSKTLASALTAGLIITATSASAADDAKKGYGYDIINGAEKWGQIDDGYALCERGDMQSPIDLAGANATANITPELDYERGAMEVVNNGHTVQVNFPAGSTMKSGDMMFNLVQVHFHTPSEHAISGKRYPLVGHVVHATTDGKLGVLGVMFETGAENNALRQILKVVPNAEQDGPMQIAEVFDPYELLPKDMRVFRYMGSLTTPPCSEGVNWHVLQAPMTASAAQIAKFEKLMGMNARPVRALNNRLVVAPE